VAAAELICCALTGRCTRQIARNADRTGVAANKTAAQAGGGIAKRARLQLASHTGRRVASGDNDPSPPAQKASMPPSKS
jgi:DNA-damage-inducible protein D